LTQTCDVDVWLVSLIVEPLQDILSEDELMRAARFRFESDRTRWLCARSALRTVLAECTGISGAEIRFVLGPHGKPAVSQGGVEFSLSHAGDWAMIAVTSDVPVGIDIERIRENVDMAALLARLGETNLPAGQTALFAAWTRREAMTKALGGALMDMPAGDLRTCDLDAPEGYFASLALIGRQPRVRRHTTGKTATGSTLMKSPGTFL
jgi:4'-phosphopantetheinyl transferase